MKREAVAVVLRSIQIAADKQGNVEMLRLAETIAADLDAAGLIVSEVPA